jgi:hypothetical protein
MGGFCQSVTVPEILTELLKSAPNANKKVSDRAKDPAKKAGKATSEIFEKMRKFFKTSFLPLIFEIFCTFL